VWEPPRSRQHRPSSSIPTQCRQFATAKLQSATQNWSCNILTQEYNKGIENIKDSFFFNARGLIFCQWIDIFLPNCIQLNIKMDTLAYNT
jgi:hypothetical protein